MRKDSLCVSQEVGEECVAALTMPFDVAECDSQCCIPLGRLGAMAAEALEGDAEELSAHMLLTGELPNDGIGVEFLESGGDEGLIHFLNIVKVYLIGQNGGGWGSKICERFKRIDAFPVPQAHTIQALPQRTHY